MIPAIAPQNIRNGIGATPARSHHRGNGDGFLANALVPYDRFWAITEDFRAHFASVSPQMYAAMQSDPKVAMRMIRSGVQAASPAFALGLTDKRADDYDDEYDEIIDDDAEEETEAPAPPYQIIDGVALLSVDGPMTKKPTSAMWMFGGTSTILFMRK